MDSSRLPFNTGPEAPELSEKCQEKQTMGVILEELAWQKGQALGVFVAEKNQF